MERVSAKAVRLVAMALFVFSVSLALLGLFDGALLARFPVPTRPMMLAAAIAYAAVGVATWRLASAAEPTVLLTRYRDVLVWLLAAYAVSFVPLGYAVLPMAAAASLASEGDHARALGRALRAFVAVAALLSATAFAIAVRAEDVFRQRLEGLVQLTSLGLGFWHALTCVLGTTQAAALSAYAASPNPSSWRRFAVSYRRTWAIAATASLALVALFLLTVVFIHLEASSGPPR